MPPREAKGQLSTKLPLGSNTDTRALSLSLIRMRPRESGATPCGTCSCPGCDPLTPPFDFTLEFRPGAPLSAPGRGQAQLPPEIEARADFFTAIQEQLGLKIENTRSPSRST